MSEYEEHANEFAKKYGVTLKAEYRGHFPRLSEYAVAQFMMTLERGGKSFRFEYSASLNDSWRHTHFGKRIQGLPYNLHTANWPRTNRPIRLWSIDPVVPKPSMYDVLACLTKYDPGTHEEFCSEFGYDPDSRKGLEIYLAVQEEWRNVELMFRDCLEELAEIN